MAGYTKGPWRVTEKGYVAAKEGRLTNDYIRIVSPWVEGAWDGDTEALANARLIAAAPELLEALIALVGTKAQTRDSFESEDDDGEWEDLLCLVGHIRDARAAIAKATGADQ